jgi:hypothetical protein
MLSSALAFPVYVAVCLCLPRSCYDWVRWRSVTQGFDYGLQDYKEGGRTRALSGHRPADTPLPPPFFRLLQVILRDVEVRACAALYLLLPGRGRAGAPEAPATGWAAFYMSTAEPATSYKHSGCAAVHACVRLACVRLRVGVRYSQCTAC